MRTPGILALGIGGALVVAACSSFNGADPATGTGPGGDGDGGADGAPPVTGDPNAPGPLGLALAGPVRITTGGSATLKVTLNASSFVGAVHVTATGLPKGISAPELVITSPTSDGEIKLTAAADTVQGPISGVVINALAPGGATDAAKADLFVRGVTGSLDTTYATGGSMDLGLSSTVVSRRYTKYLFVGTPNTGVRRFAPDGTLDAAFAATLGGYKVAMAPDESVFASDGTYIRHYSSSGAADTTFTAAKVDLAAHQRFQLGPNATGDLVIVANPTISSNIEGFSVSSTGIVGASTTYDGQPFSTDTNYVGALEADAGGTFLVGVGAKSKLRIIRVKSDASCDTSFFYMGTSDVPIPAAANGNTGVYGLHKTSDGTYVLGGSNTGLYLIRQNNVGGGDSSFGDGTMPAVAQVALGLTGGRAAFDLDSAGRPLVVWVLTGSTSLTMSRYTKKGVVDTAFGTAGSVTLNMGASPSLQGLHIIDDERALVVSTHDGDAFIQRIWL